MKKEIDRIAELTRKISTMKALIGVFNDGQPYFSTEYVKDILSLEENEMRMMKIEKIFNYE